MHKTKTQFFNIPQILAALEVSDRLKDTIRFSMEEFQALSFYIHVLLVCLKNYYKQDSVQL